MDGRPDKLTLRRRRYAAHRCVKCGQLHQWARFECRRCGARNFDSVSLKAREYCAVFGHNESELLVPGTDQVVRERTVQQGRRIVINVMSYEYSSCCTRCGEKQKKRKKMIPPTVLPKTG